MSVERRNKVFELMNDQSLLVLFAGTEKHLSQDQLYPFEVSRNFYYLTNINVEKQILLMHKGEQNFVFLFIEENTELKAKWDGARMSKVEASEKSGIPVSHIHYLNEFETFVKTSLGVSRLSSVPAETIYLDLLRIHGNENPDVQEYVKHVQNTYPELQIKNIEPQMANLRQIKSLDEVEKIERAIAITDEAIRHMMKSAKVGMYEYQIESFFKQSLFFQHSKEAFTTIAASGENGTVLHYHANDSVVEDNQLILTDLGGSYELYNADITRTWPVNGVFTKRQKELYEVVLDTNKKCIEFAKPGITWKELNDYATKLLFEGLKALGKIEEQSELFQYYYHSIGHNLGLDVHDVGLYNKPLEEGMVLTIEPGLYIKEEGIGIRIEDNIVITKSGCKNLSHMIPKEIKEIEALMKEID